ncbi:head scaffolding protein [Ralstonia phage RSJ2]|uniref:Putative scaffolding-like protein n=1 Tax=Ralstonia phage RSJ2 TaxID=1481785 RepID=A0A068Q5R7_9CAUD|nr:head scaffolding protein [Ralstonia phage RSJ2]BAP15836.1 putative scaffolding-like protein [Ralstonia phage RSJ2]
MTEQVQAAAATADTSAATAAATQATSATPGTQGQPAAPVPGQAGQGQSGVKDMGIGTGDFSANIGKEGYSATTGIEYYGETGYAGLDAALKFMVDAGLHDDHPAVKAVEKNDFSLLEAYFAQNPVAGWETMLRIGKEGFERMLKDVGEKGAALERSNKEMGVALFGDEATLNAALEYFPTIPGVEQADVDGVQAMIRAGGVQAQAAMLLIQDQFNAAHGITRAPLEDVTQRTAPFNSGGDAGPLTARQFTEKCHELRRTLGDNFEQSAQYRALAARVRR